MSNTRLLRGLDYQKKNRLTKGKKLEKELYSKEYVVESTNFVVNRAKTNKSKVTNKLSDYNRFSCNLATIFARDKKVVAVRLKTSSDNLNSSDSYNKYNIKSFKEYISANCVDETDLYKMISIYYKYYSKVKDDSCVSKKFLGYVKKMGSYVLSI
ncbi:hypothetical protein C1646_770943 [Rhizophagus diaphanus]|nr:hypothetical protein C1646_770943 [Rhizophagus diaphanus] [Rhizophagus sp. MUCL 43196]